MLAPVTSVTAQGLAGCGAEVRNTVERVGGIYTLDYRGRGDVYTRAFSTCSPISTATSASVTATTGHW